MRPAGTRVFANYIGTVLQSFNNNSFHTIRAPARFEPESTRDPTATHRLTSQVRGTKIHPHNLPDLLSGRGLTHEGQVFFFLGSHISRSSAILGTVSKANESLSKLHTSIIRFLMTFFKNLVFQSNYKVSYKQKCAAICYSLTRIQSQSELVIAKACLKDTI
jgi:hypothetical protein